MRACYIADVVPPAKAVGTTFESNALTGGTTNHCESTLRQLSEG